MMESKRMILELEDGNKFVGIYFGAKERISGELVFQTNTTGYPEAITDPSYASQILTFTTPMLGNYGFPKMKKDEYGLDITIESSKPSIKAVICQEYVNNYNHWEAESSLSDYLKKHNIVGISDIDTRELTKYIRSIGSCKAIIYPEITLLEKPHMIDINENHLVEMVSIKEPILYYPKNIRKEKSNKSNKILFLIVVLKILN